MTTSVFITEGFRVSHDEATGSYVIALLEGGTWHVGRVRMTEMYDLVDAVEKVRREGIDHGTTGTDCPTTES